MTIRTTITLDEEAARFLNAHAAGNRSAYIGHLLHQEKQRKLAERIALANREEGEDPAYMAEIAAWDATLSDGIE